MSVRSAPGTGDGRVPLADSRRDTLGPWAFDFDLDETVTVLDGIRNRAGAAVEVGYAPGIRPAHRTFPSMFDMFDGTASADPPGFDDAAELARAVSLAQASDVAVVVTRPRAPARSADMGPERITALALPSTGAQHGGMRRPIGA